MSTTDVPDTLAEIRDAFLETPESDRLLLLLEFSDELPPVSDEVANHPEMCERVAECQSPVYIYVEVTDGVVTMPRFAVARHTKLWNYDQTGWSAAITRWLAASGFSASA